jgi:hypothetical protein
MFGTVFEVTFVTLQYSEVRVINILFCSQSS